jgi:hypothetical protein
MVASSGCGLYFGGDDDEPDASVGDTCHPNVPTIDPDATPVYYVVNTTTIPKTAAEANELGLDIDGDDQARPDNNLGQVLSIFSSDYDLDAEQQALIDSGAIIHLLELRAASLTTATRVGMTLMHGRDTDGDPSDNLTGNESFAIDTSRGQGTMYGCITSGTVDVRRGTIPLAITFPGLDQPFIVELVGTRIDARVTATSLDGRIGGGIHEDELDQSVIPALAEGLNRIVDRDCDGSVCSGTGGAIVDLFDTNDDLDISIEELRNSALVGALLAPDLDLFDSNGNYAPLTDGVEDSLSVGLGFTAVGASLQ